MADFGKCWKSSQSPENVAQMLANGFLSAYGAFREDLEKINKGPKSTDFEQKASVIADGFEDGDCGKCWKSSKLPKTSPKWLQVDC